MLQFLVFFPLFIKPKMSMLEVLEILSTASWGLYGVLRTAYQVSDWSKTEYRADLGVD